MNCTVATEERNYIPLHPWNLGFGAWNLDLVNA